MGAAGHGVFVDADSWPKDPGDEVIRPGWVSGSRDDHGIGVEPSNGGDVSDQPAHRLLAGKDSIRKPFALLPVHSTVVPSASTRASGGSIGTGAEAGQ